MFLFSQVHGSYEFRIRIHALQKHVYPLSLARRKVWLHHKPRISISVYSCKQTSMLNLQDIICEGGRDSLLILETGDKKSLGGLHKWDGNLGHSGSKPRTSFLDRKDFYLRNTGGKKSPLQEIQQTRCMKSSSHRLLRLSPAYQCHVYEQV